MQRTPINFPMIGDLDRNVKGFCGTIYSNVNERFTERSVFVVDLTKKVKHSVTFPAST